MAVRVLSITLAASLKTIFFCHHLNAASLSDLTKWFKHLIAGPVRFLAAATLPFFKILTPLSRNVIMSAFIIQSNKYSRTLVETVKCSKEQRTQANLCRLKSIYTHAGLLIIRMIKC